MQPVCFFIIHIVYTFFTVIRSVRRMLVPAAVGLENRFYGLSGASGSPYGQQSPSAQTLMPIPDNAWILVQSFLQFENEHRSELLRLEAKSFFRIAREFLYYIEEAGFLEVYVRIYEFHVNTHDLSNY